MIFCLGDTYIVKFCIALLMCMEIYVPDGMDSINVFRKNSLTVKLKSLLENLGKLKLTQKEFDLIVMAIESNQLKDPDEEKKRAKLKKKVNSPGSEPKAQKKKVEKTSEVLKAEMLELERATEEAILDQALARTKKI